MKTDNCHNDFLFSIDCEYQFSSKLPVANMYIKLK